VVSVTAFSSDGVGMPAASIDKVAKAAAAKLPG